MQQSTERRENKSLRALVTAGNLAAQLASEPDAFSTEYRQQVVRAWNAALRALRNPGQEPQQ